MKVIVYIVISVDGFIVCNNGGIDWLFSVGDIDSSEDYGYQEFIDLVDVFVMGWNIYELVLFFDLWFYGEKLVFVLSSWKVDIFEDIIKIVEFMSVFL